jgi:glutamate-1-semialdehyde 2,1-aminomutase
MELGGLRTATIERQDALLAEGVNEAARQAGIEEHVRAVERPSCLTFETRDDQGQPAGVPHAVLAGDDVERGVGPVIRHLRGAH